MCRRFVLFVFIVLVEALIIGSSAVSTQAEQTVFGPEEFLRTIGAVNAYEEAFQAGEGPGKLIIKNGEEDTKHRVTSAQIYLNDDLVFEPDDFKQDVYILEFSLDLNQTNDLKIEIGGKPGTFLVIEIVQEKSASPPVFEPVTDQEVFEEHELTFTVHAQDPNNDPLTYSVLNLPPGAVFDSATQAFSWTPEIGQAGVYSPEFTVSDGDLTDTVMVKIAVLANPPTVTISADPEAIADGETSTLSWTSTYADTAALEPGIGTVDVNGSLAVTPGETTIYTISVTGPGGTATDAAAVNVVHPPTVTFSAEPIDINGGETATLAWITTNTDSVSIEPDIGPVDLIGTMTVSPLQTTTYTLIANGSGITRTAAVTITVNNPITIQITSPLEGANVSNLEILVTGTVIHSGGKETGVTVNGIAALMNDDEFMVNQIPLMDGENVLVAKATDILGNSMTDSITVYAQTSRGYIKLTVNPVSGVAPFETTLRIDTSFDFTASDISYTGPGTVTFLENTAEEYRVLMAAEGLYSFTATVMDGQGYVYTSIVAVEVIDKAKLDTLLRMKWDGMKTALIEGNIDAALEYFADGRAKDRYREIFDFIEENVPGGVSVNAQQLPDPILIRLDGPTATYILTRNENGKIIEFNLSFIQNSFGLWKIQEY